MRMAADVLTRRAAASPPAPLALSIARPAAAPSYSLLGDVPAPACCRTPPLATRRRRIWELSGHMHCSIIGTCLTGGELRQILGRLHLVQPGASEHDLHGIAVGLAGRHDAAGKLLHKAIDQRHRLAVRQFDEAGDAAALAVRWRAARQEGDIPGAYWAVMTHPATSEALLREVFGEVHMLSHLVGAANRADISRLARLETENAALAEQAARQQERLRATALERAATIGELRRALAAAAAQRRDTIPAEAAPAAAAAGELGGRLAAAEERCALVERRLAERCASLTREAERRVAAERRAADLAAEIAALEGGLADEPRAEAPAGQARPPAPRLSGLTILYVGGRAGLVGHLHSAASRHGAALLHHDGGIEERSGRLPGLVGRADLVVFPVDCVSHEAAITIKRLCRSFGRRFVPLRSSGLGSFLAALAGLDASESADRATASA